jgi:colanic acid/amylovoran biosynthesis glycosyltransferase
MEHERLRIAYLINQYPKVSHTFIRREIQALERRGFEVVRIALRGWDADLADPEDLRERDRTFHILRRGWLSLPPAVMRMLLTRPLRLMRTLALAWRMARRADRPLPVHLAYLAEACIVMPLLRSTGARHLHAHFATNSAEVAMLARELGGPAWSFTCHGVEFDNPDFIKLAEKVRRSAFAVAVSSYGRSQLYRFIGHELWPKIQLVHCGVESDFHAGHASPPPAERRLLCVGRLCKEKGQLLLVEAARLLAAGGQQFELVLAGDGEQRSDVEALIARHKLENRIRTTGWISSEQVRAEILAARALVLPSFAEGLPVVIMEAMALGRPVISTCVAGIPELVISREHGWLVPAGDVETLAKAMQTCLQAPGEVLTAMGEAARKRVLERHDVEIAAGKLGKLFESVARD